VRAVGTQHVPEVARWWPHSHGKPVLYEASLHVTTSAETVTIDAGRVGFRTIAAGSRSDHEVDVDGLDLHINGVSVFARGRGLDADRPVSRSRPAPEALRRGAHASHATPA